MIKSGISQGVQDSSSVSICLFFQPGLSSYSDLEEIPLSEKKLTSVQFAQHGSNFFLGDYGPHKGGLERSSLLPSPTWFCGNFVQETTIQQILHCHEFTRADNADIM